MFDNFKPIDLKAQKRNRQMIFGGIHLVLLSGFLYFEFKNYPEEHRVSMFFTALQAQEFQKAYEIWHPAPTYKFTDFTQDWGAHGVNWPVKHFHITSSREKGSGVVIRIRVNDSEEEMTLWVEKKDKSISFPP